MKIKKNVDEGRPLNQSIAIAYSQARAAGYKVPAYHGKHSLSAHVSKKHSLKSIS